MGNPGRQNGQQGNYPNNSGRQPVYQQQQPTLYDRTSKLEETLEKFMQASLTNQKN